MKISKHYNQKKLKELGFSSKLIKELLPEPHLVPNPHHKDGKPMKLWDKNLVRRVMNSEEFKKYQATRQRRSFAMKKSFEEKRLETKNIMIEALKNLTVKVVSLDELDNLVKQYHKTIKPNHIKNRHRVNIIRHKLTNYEELYRSLSGRIGGEQAYCFLKEELLKVIARYYPYLESECAHQIFELRLNRNENKKLILEIAKEYGHNK